MSDVAFPRTLETLRSGWDTSGGQALRSLLWSLYNDRVAVSLWSRITDLDESLRLEFAQLLCPSQDERAAIIGTLLEESGEMDRIDTVPLREESDV